MIEDTKELKERIETALVEDLGKDMVKYMKKYNATGDEKYSKLFKATQKGLADRMTKDKENRLKR